MKKAKMVMNVAVLIVTALIILAGAAHATSEKKWPDAVSFGVPSVGSSAYITYSGLGEMLRKYLNVTGTAEAVGGSTSIVALLGKKRLEFGQVSTNVLYDCVRGKGRYKDKKVDLRQICPGISFAMHFFARADSNIRKAEDVKGKRFICYSPTAAIQTLMGKLLLESMGMNRDDVIAMPLVSQPDAARALRDGTADAFEHAGSPIAAAAAYAEMANSIDVKLIPITEKQQSYMAKNSSNVLFPLEIRGGLYKGNPNPVRTVAFDVPFVCLPEMPVNLVYEITKLIFGEKHHGEFEAIHPVAKTWALDRLKKEPAVAPYHEGAIKFYKEKGVWSEELEKQQRKLLEALGLSK